MKRIVILLASFLVSWSSVAQHRPGVPYAEVVRLPLALKAQSSKINVAYAVKPGKDFKDLPKDLKVEIVVADRRIPVKVGADGALDLPLREDWVDAGAYLVNNQPFGRTTLTMNWRFQHHWNPNPIGALQMPYASFEEARKEFDQIAFGFPKPMKLTGWMMVFEKPSSEVRVVMADGAIRVLQADVTGRLMLPIDPAWADAKLEFGSALRSIMPVPTPISTSRG